MGKVGETKEEGNGGNILKEIDIKQCARCLLAMACMFITTRLLNADVIAPLTVLSPFARDVAFFTGSSLYAAVIAYGARGGWNILRGSRWLSLSCVLCIGGTACFVFGILDCSAVIMGIGFAISEIGSTTASIIIGVALCEMYDIKMTALIVCFGYAIARGFDLVLPLFDVNARYALFAFLPCIEIILVRRLAIKNIGLLARASKLADYEISQPNSFISPFNSAFIVIMLGQLMFGFGLALNCVSGVPIATPWTGLLAVGIGGCILGSHEMIGHEDALFQIASLLISAGMLLALTSFFIDLGVVSNVVLSAGSLCLTVLNWLVLSAIGGRNKLNALFVVAWGRALASLGTMIGADLGHLSNAFSGSQTGTAVVIICMVFFIFIAYSEIALKKFDFRTVIYGVEPVQEVQAPAVVHDMHDRYELRCQEVGERYGLTARETEILVMLAQGRNSKFIENQLFVSYNTVKTHVKHVYMKIGVHSQQELIDLVIGDEL